MSSWARIEGLHEEAQFWIKQKYEEHGLPWQVRKFLAGWIETARENLLLCSVEEWCNGYVGHFLSQLGTVIIALEQPGRPLEELSAATVLRNVYYSVKVLEHQPEFLYKLRNCLTEENRIFSQVEISNVQTQIQNQNPVVFNWNLQDLELVYAAPVPALVPPQNQNQMATITQMDTHNTKFSEKMSKLVKSREEFKRQLNSNQVAVSLETASLLSSRLMEELAHLVPLFIDSFLYKLKWSQLSRLWVDTEPMMDLNNTSSSTRDEDTATVEQISLWFSQLVSTIELLMWRSPWISPENKIQLKTWRKDTISNGLYVVQQPGQTILKGSPLDSKVKFLRDERAAGSGAPVFNIFVLNEIQARDLFMTKNLRPASYLHLETNGNILDDDQSKIESKKKEKARQKYKKGLKGPKNRTKTKGEDKVVQRKSPPCVSTGEDPSISSSVLEKKSVLLYVTTTRICESLTQVWCCSVPFVFMTNNTQNCAASVTVFWDNYFQEENRLPFQVPETVPWPKFARALRHYFQMATNTKWVLTSANLDYIGLKIFGQPGPHEGRHVSRRTFCVFKKGIINVWTWLFHIMKLVQSQKSIPWESGAIVGFIDRTEAETILASKPKSFIIRFSDSELGAISITSSTPSKKTTSVEPMNNSHLTAIPLIEVLRGLQYCERVIYFGQDGQECSQEKLEMFSTPEVTVDQKADAGPSSAPIVINGKVRQPYEKAKRTLVVESLNSDPEAEQQAHAGPSDLAKWNGAEHLQDSSLDSCYHSYSSSSNPFEEDSNSSPSDWSDWLDGAGTPLELMESVISISTKMTDDDVDMDKYYLSLDNIVQQQQ